MKRTCAAFIFGLAFLVSLAGPAYAHGTGYRTPQNKPAALEFYYSTGEAMAYQEAKVYSPQDEKFAFQSGLTDEYGRFAFVPDAPGHWRVTVKDMEGHMTEAALDVPEDFFEAGGAARAKSSAPEGLDLYLRAALGVSVLFNAAAFASLRKRKKAGS